MVFKGRLDGSEAAASLKNSSVSLSVGEGYVVSWDLGGRLFSVFRGGDTFRRGLSGRVLHKWRDASLAPDAESAYDERQRVVLAPAEADALLDECAALAARALEAMRRDPPAWGAPASPGVAAGPPDVAAGFSRVDSSDRALQNVRLKPDAPSDLGSLWERLLEALDRCARFDAAAARADATRFAEVYSPIGILPPDQYLSTVLQATSGCSFGTCTFCDLYRDGYRVKTAGEFERHVRAVLAYLGPSFSLRSRSVFLGAANALAVPLPRLVELLGVLRGVFDEITPALGHSAFSRRRTPPKPGATPVFGFVDGFTGALKDAAAYRQLAALGLARVYIGLESGHDPLLAFVRKPGTSGQARDTVRAIKEAGVGVGVIVMIGLGGRRFAEGHVADTIGCLNAMGLGAGDLVYFSDLVEVPGSSYPAAAAAADVQPLPAPERIAQLREIRRGLRFPGPPPKFARYDIREFVY